MRRKGKSVRANPRKNMIPNENERIQHHNLSVILSAFIHLLVCFLSITFIH